jgi:hypothetical protein
MAGTAVEQAPDASEAIRSWQLRRTARRHGMRLLVGHTDLAARPPPT